MTTMPKLIARLKVARWISGIMSSVLMALAVPSYFVWIRYPVPPRAEGYNMTISNGVLGVAKNMQALWTTTDSYQFKRELLLPFESYMYLPRYEARGNAYYLGIPLLGLGLASLLVFLFIWRKESKLRRKAIFAAQTSDEESL